MLPRTWEDGGRGEGSQDGEGWRYQGRGSGVLGTIGCPDWLGRCVPRGRGSRTREVVMVRMGLPNAGLGSG